jgi:hypothetical protein
MVKNSHDFKTTLVLKSMTKNILHIIKTQIVTSFHGPIPLIGGG